MTQTKKSAEAAIEREVRQLLERSFEGKVVPLASRPEPGTPDRKTGVKVVDEVERAAVLIEYYNLRVQRLREDASALQRRRDELIRQGATRTSELASAESKVRSQSFRAEQAEVRLRVLRKQSMQLEVSAANTSLGLDRLVKAVDAYLAVPST